MKNQGDMFEFDELGRICPNNPKNFQKIIVINFKIRKRTYFYKNENDSIRNILNSKYKNEKEIR